MPITVALAVTPTTPGHGDTVTARYIVTGNDGSPPQAAEVNGHAAIGEQLFSVSTVLTLPGTDPLGEAFTQPTGGGLAWTATDDPHVWTAVVP